MYKPRLATMIKTLREEKGITQVELAQKAKVTQSYVAMLEAGEKKNPSLDVLKRLAKALKVKVGELVE